MCGLEIILHPNEGLRAKAQDVKDVNDSRVVRVLEDLFETLDAYDHCVGLAANQIGSNLNIFVADASKNKSCESQFGRIAVINPVIQIKEDLEKSREGCMSVPDFTGDVFRARKVTVQAIDENGDTLHLEAKGFEAKVFQHEIDHLNGKLFLDRVKSSRDIFARKRYR